MEIYKNECGYAPLQVNCEGYWDTPLNELPEPLKRLVTDNLLVFRWDELDAAERRRIAAQNDYHQNPDYEPSVYFNLAKFEDEVLKRLNAAQEQGKDAAIVAYRYVTDGVREVLNTDRTRVGVEIQRLRMAANKVPKYPPVGGIESAERPLSTRERDGLLNIIGGLLELLQDRRPTRADTTSQARIISALVASYSDKEGISQRNLESKFADANRSLNHR